MPSIHMLLHALISAGFIHSQRRLDVALACVYIVVSQDKRENLDPVRTLPTTISGADRHN